MQINGTFKSGIDITSTDLVTINYMDSIRAKKLTKIMLLRSNQKIHKIFMDPLIVMEEKVLMSSQTAL